MSDQKDEKEPTSQIIPSGKQQETGFTRFVKTDDVNPDIIKDARINNLQNNLDEVVDGQAEDTVYNSFIHPSENNEKQSIEPINDLKQAIDDQEKI